MSTVLEILSKCSTPSEYRAGRTKALLRKHEKKRQKKHMSSCQLLRSEEDVDKEETHPASAVSQANLSPWSLIAFKG